MDQGEKYLSGDIIKKLIGIMSNQLLEKLLNEVREVALFSILAAKNSFVFQLDGLTLVSQSMSLLFVVYLKLHTCICVSCLHR